MFQLPGTQNALGGADVLLKQVIEPMLQREIRHRSIVSENCAYEAKLIGWVEVS
jgi:hypothetical protein